jgi:hypothetical protein
MIIWTALCGGATLYVVLARLIGGLRRTGDDFATASLWAMGASGMFAMGITAADLGRLVPAVVSAAVGVVLTVDLPPLWMRLSAHLPRGHASTVTPFQNAT